MSDWMPRRALDCGSIAADMPVVSMTVPTGQVIITGAGCGIITGCGVGRQRPPMTIAPSAQTISPQRPIASGRMWFWMYIKRPERCRWI